MTISKTLRYSIVIILIVFMVKGIAATYTRNDDLVIDIFEITLEQIILDITVTFISMLLLATYFAKRRFWLPFIAIIALNSNVIIYIIYEYMIAQHIIYKVPSNIAIISLMLFFTHFLYGISFLISKARFHFWLKLYGASFFILMILDITMHAISGNSQIIILLDYLNILNLSTMIIHFLRPDKIELEKNSDIIDDLEIG